jgi:hypothetical protein
MDDECQRIDFYWSDIVPGWVLPSLAITGILLLIASAGFYELIKWYSKE